MKFPPQGTSAGGGGGATVFEQYQSAVNLSAGNVTLPASTSTSVLNIVVYPGSETNLLLLNASLPRLFYVVNGSAGSCLVKNNVADELDPVSIGARKGAFLMANSAGAFRMTADQAQ